LEYTKPSDGHFNSIIQLHMLHIVWPWLLQSSYYMTFSMVYRLRIYLPIFLISGNGCI